MSTFKSRPSSQDNSATTDGSAGALLSLHASISELDRIQRHHGKCAWKGAPLPLRVIQYWDQNPPEQIAQMIAHNRALCLSAGIDHVLLNDEQALQFLQTQMDSRVVEAYERAPHPAMKCDLLRLCYLYQNGGYYVDADVVLRDGFEDLFSISAELVVFKWNEATRSNLCNWLIGSAPRSSVLAFALKETANSILLASQGDKSRMIENALSISGPGIFTRSVATAVSKKTQEINTGVGSVICIKTVSYAYSKVQSALGYLGQPPEYKTTARHWLVAGKERVTDASLPYNRSLNYPGLPRPSRRLSRLWLHIGLEKTGSTSILETLRASGNALTVAGLEIPRGRHDQRALSHAFREAPMVELSQLNLGGIEQERAYRLGLLEELHTQLCHTQAEEALISDEMLAGLSEEEAKELAKFLEPLADEVRVLAYVRSPIDAALSLSQQLIKTGHALYSEMVEKPAYRSVKQRLKVYWSAFGRNAVTVRVFDRNRLHHGLIQHDLLNAIGHSKLTDRLTLHNSNESITLAAALLKSAMTRLSPIPVRHHAFLMAITGPAFSLPTSAQARAEEITRKDRLWLQQSLGLTFPDQRPWALPDLRNLFNTEVMTSIHAARNNVPLELQSLYDCAVQNIQLGILDIAEL